MRSLSSVVLLAAAMLVLSVSPALAQLEEPEVLGISSPRSPLDEGYRNSIAFDIMLNNFGFGIGGQYTHMLSSYTELTFQTGITGIRDVSEQNFQDFFSGQQIIPNKYNRALGFPFLLGLKQRLFARQIEDNFRFFVASSAGPVMAFVYPYLDDEDDNGYRSLAPVNVDGTLLGYTYTERINDFFTGWKDGNTEWGAAGEIKIGVDLGSNFKRQTTVEFGYLFYYFDQGIQIMQPRKPELSDDGSFIIGNDGEIVTEPFHSEQNYFGTPRISIKFGGRW